MTHVENHSIDINEFLGEQDMTINKEMVLLDVMKYLGIRPTPLSIPTPEEIEAASRRNLQRMLDSIR
jgi:hypothetical protein